jgi:hypothetical protein
MRKAIGKDMSDISDLESFYNRVEHADWFYEMSDDHSVWERGCNQFGKLQAEANGNAEKEKILKDWTEFHYSGEAFGKPQAPKPERPQ